MSSLIRINLRDLPLDKPLDFDLISQNRSLMLPKGRLLTWDVVEKLEEVPLFVEGYGVDTGGIEPASVVTNNLAEMELGKEVQSFYLFMKEGNNYKLLPAEYIGWIKDLAIVIEMPRSGQGTQSRMFQLEPGQKIQAKLHSGKYEYVFQSYVMCVTNNPLPHVHIKHPSKVKQVVLRQAHRKECDIDSEILIPDVAHAMPVKIVDISDSGAAIMCEAKLNDTLEYKLKIHFVINGLKQAIDIPFVIKNTKSWSLKMRYGVAFAAELPIKEKVFLQSFIYTL